MMPHWKAEYCFFCVNKKYQKCIHKHITLFHKKTPRNLIRALYGGYILYFTKWRIGKGDLATCYEPASLFLVLQKVIRPFRPFVSTNVPSFDQGKLSGCSSGYAWR